MMTTNLFVIANVQQLRTGGSFRILLAFFQTSWGVGVLNWAIFNSFHNRVEFGTISEGLRIFEGGGFEPRKLSPPLATPLVQVFVAGGSCISFYPMVFIYTVDLLLVHRRLLLPLCYWQTGCRCSV